MIAKQINQNWKFWQETKAFNMAWRIPENARIIELPHDPMIEKPVNPDSPNGSNTGYRDGGVYAYALELDAPKSWKHRTVMLKFEGVYMHAMVYVNGQLAAKCPYGYTGFYVSLNDWLNYGGRNEILVMARSGAMKNSRWYSGAGIYRDVYLLEAGETYLVPEGVQIQTESIDGGIATVRLSAEIHNRLSVPANVRVEQCITAPDGQQAACGCVHAVLFGAEERRVRQRIVIDKPQLWDAEHPSLYTCTTRLYGQNEDGEVLLDEQTDTFGIRTLQVDARRGFRVNGQRVELRGACIHHDSGLLGAATWEDAQYRQIAKLKEAGFNAIRMSHHPAAPVLLRACDELGMYVMDEVTDIWTRLKSDYDSGLFFDEWWAFDVTAMVRKDFNHPSVVLYSVGNEIPEIGTPAGAKICHDMCEKIRSLDPTRFTLASINGMFTVGGDMPRIVADIAAQARARGEIEGDVNEFMTVMRHYHDDIARHDLISQRLELACASTDIAGYNYMTARYATDGVKYPDRVIVGSETFPPAIAENWHCVKTMPHVIGDFCWTGWDYIGESHSGFPTYEEDDESQLFPSQFSTAGDIDITGFRKPMSYFREIVFGLRKEPYIAVQHPFRYGQKLKGNPWQISDTISAWTWRGHEYQPVVVEVYSAGEEVELQLNGRSVGKKAAGEAAGFRTLFETIYEPGEIIAITYEQGKEIGRFALRTAERHMQLRLSPEVLPAGHDRNLAYVNVALADANGCVFPDDDRLLTLNVANATLLGFGNGYTRQKHNFSEAVSMTWLGRALIILKRDPEQPLYLTVEADGLEPAVLTLP